MDRGTDEAILANITAELAAGVPLSLVALLRADATAAQILAAVRHIQHLDVVNAVGVSTIAVRFDE